MHNSPFTLPESERMEMISVTVARSFAAPEPPAGFHIASNADVRSDTPASKVLYGTLTLALMSPFRSGETNLDFLPFAKRVEEETGVLLGIVHARRIIAERASIPSSWMVRHRRVLFPGTVLVENRVKSYAYVPVLLFSGTGAVVLEFHCVDFGIAALNFESGEETLVLRIAGHRQ